MMLHNYVPQLIRSVVCFQSIFLRTKSSIDFTKVPKLVEDELEEQFVRGSGPGGQAVNKTANCVVLKHKPSGIVIKCHESRSLNQNRKSARSILITRLDHLYNKNESVEHQLKQIQTKKILELNRRRNKLKLLKEEWKNREDCNK